MKIGFTGSKGVLGSALIKLLKKNNLYHFKGRVENIKEIQNWIKNNDFDAIIHLAAMVPTYLVNNCKKKALKVNYNGTKNIIDTINKYSKKKIWFFYSSTSHVYKFNDKKTKESASTKPISYYGQTKLLGEKYLLKNKKNIIFTKNDKKTILYGCNMKLKKLGWKKNPLNYTDYLLNKF